MSTMYNPEEEISLNRQWAEQAFSPGQGGQAAEHSLPFSFVYGGRNSSEFLRMWSREVKEEKVSDTMSRRTLTLTDPDTQLEVKAVCLIYLDTAGVDWTVYFTNKGDKDSPVIEQVKALDTAVLTGTSSPGRAPPAERRSVRRPTTGCPSTSRGSKGTADRVRRHERQVVQRLSLVQRRLGQRRCHHGHRLVRPVERLGEAQDGDFAAQAGMQNLHTVLHPGESIRSPRILQLHWQGGDQYRAYNLFRRTMFAHIMPRIDGQLVVPPIVHLSTSFYELNDSNEQNVLSHLESINGLGFEMFWLDAYWTGPNGFPNSMGNYGFPIERVEPRTASRTA